MPRRHWSFLPLLATLALACGGGDTDDANDGSTDGTSAAAADEVATPAGTAADSIPMEISVTASGGPTNNDGTFTSRGMGQRCTYDGDAQPRATRAAWNVVFSSDDSSSVRMLTLDVGAPVSDTTSAFSLALSAGTSTAAGMTMPMQYMVGTWPGGAKLGSGTVKVTRVGDGARFEVNAVDGASRTRLAMTATCARLGAVD